MKNRLFLVPVLISAFFGYYSHAKILSYVMLNKGEQHLILLSEDAVPQDDKEYTAFLKQISKHKGLLITNQSYQTFKDMAGRRNISLKTYSNVLLKELPNSSYAFQLLDDSYNKLSIERRSKTTLHTSIDSLKNNYTLDTLHEVASQLCLNQVLDAIEQANQKYIYVSDFQHFKKEILEKLYKLLTEKYGWKLKEEYVFPQASSSVSSSYAAASSSQPQATELNSQAAPIPQMAAPAPTPSVHFSPEAMQQMAQEVIQRQILNYAVQAAVCVAGVASIGYLAYFAVKNNILGRVKKALVPSLVACASELNNFSAYRLAWNFQRS